MSFQITRYILLDSYYWAIHELEFIFVRLFMIFSFPSHFVSILKNNAVIHVSGFKYTTKMITISIARKNNRSIDTLIIL